MHKFVRIVLVLSVLLTISVSANALDDEFKIKSGDVLQITVWKEADLDREVAVLSDGTITFPLVGSIALQDLTPSQAQDLIKTKLKRMIPDAAVTVTIKAPLGHVVSVTGQVAKPGDIVMSRNITVMQALSQAGGLTPFASEGGIVVLRNVNGKKESIDYAYDDVASGDSLDKDIDLMPGDVIFVPTAGLF